MKCKTDKEEARKGRDEDEIVNTGKISEIPEDQIRKRKRSLAGDASHPRRYHLTHKAHHV